MIEIIILLIIDQVAKWLVKASLQPSSIYGVIKYIFSFTYVENRGCAFGMFNTGTFYLIIFTLLVIIALLYEYMKNIRYSSSIVLKQSFILLLAGAIGNLIDRVCRGYVIDFINLEFVDFAVFNLADCYICIGCALIVIYILFVMNRRTKLKINF
ncbi:MAG: signal peptidase II [Clostridia bacterium]|nr:signal peptidase II [Clostridia bacterium]